MPQIVCQIKTFCCLVPYDWNGSAYFCPKCRVNLTRDIQAVDEYIETGDRDCLILGYHRYSPVVYEPILTVEEMQAQAEKRRELWKAYKSLGKSEHKVSPETTKICLKCLVEKELNHFAKGSGLYGKSSKCLRCYRTKRAQ